MPAILPSEAAFRTRVGRGRRGAVRYRSGAMLDDVPARHRPTEDERLLGRQDASFIHTDPWRIHRITSEFVAGFDALAEVGLAVSMFGSARTKPGDPVSAHAGIESHAKLGDRIEPGQSLFTLFAEDPALLDEPEHMLRETLQITPAPVARPPLIREVIPAN